jgi:hypothetical protein
MKIRVIISGSAMPLLARISVMGWYIKATFKIMAKSLPAQL